MASKRKLKKCKRGATRYTRQTKNGPRRICLKKCKNGRSRTKSGYCRRKKETLYSVNPDYLK